MNYFILSYIALGFVFSLVIGIEYTCVGEEKFPEFYGSPFIFKEKSLATSMEYYYSVSGLFFNVIVWSVLLFVLQYGFHRILKKVWNTKVVTIGRKIVTAILIVFATLSIGVETVFLGGSFKKGQNYWYINMNEQAKNWGMSCEGKYYFRK